MSSAADHHAEVDPAYRLAHHFESPEQQFETGKFGMVRVKALEPLARPVTLAEIKADSRLKDMVLVNNSRLSVQPVTAAEWREICRMGGLNRA